MERLIVIRQECSKAKMIVALTVGCTGSPVNHEPIQRIASQHIENNPSMIFQIRLQVVSKPHLIQSQTVSVVLVHAEPILQRQHSDQVGFPKRKRNLSINR